MATAEHSAKFEDLKARYEKNYITKDTLKKWVVINNKRQGAGITAEEYKQITGEKYAE